MLCPINRQWREVLTDVSTGPQSRSTLKLYEAVLTKLCMTALSFYHLGHMLWTTGGDGALTAFKDILFEDSILSD